MQFLLRLIACAIAVACAALLIPGIEVVGGNWMPFIMMALVLALINASIKPFLQLISLPVTIITLGIFSLIINALMLQLASGVAAGIFHSGISIDSFGSAFLAAIVISIVSTIMSSLFGVKEED